MIRITIESAPLERPDPFRVARILGAGLLALTTLLLVTGCAGLFERPVEYVPYETKVPVEVPCAAKLPPEPEWKARDIPRVDPVTGEGIDVAVDKLLAERAQRKGYEEQLRAAVGGCQ